MAAIDRTHPTKQTKQTEKTVILSTGTVKLAAGRTGTPTLKLDRTGARLLTVRHRLATALRLSVNGKLESSRRVTLKAPKPKHRTTKRSRSR